MTTSSVHPCNLALEPVAERLRRVIDVHFDPRGGSAFWLERQQARGIDARRDVRHPDDLHLLGDMTPEMFQQRPLRDFIPRRFHQDLASFLVGQTGGTTGPGAWSAWRTDEFRAAFVDPFLAAAAHLNFPTAATWLYVGPSGPHIIGKVVRHLARGLDSHDPFSVDFDPRWARRLPDGSFAQQRYLEHVVDQAMAVIDLQPVEVIFTTPAVLARLGERMSETQRHAIRGVHYGGMPLTAEALHTFQAHTFPGAIHVSGYGNTLLGCCLELSAAPGRELEYFPHGSRLLLETDEDRRVRVTRLDESTLIVRMLERDVGELVPAPADAPAGFHLPGLRNPHSPRTIAPRQATGLY
ncbi:MAG: hypothetical protein KDA21_03260 [Phycisphaerales bacterium]|nr:hypothetical protein [Phycisphaerales bacterium]